MIYLYRYKDVTQGTTFTFMNGIPFVKIEEKKFKVVKETKCGYWIQLFKFDIDDRENRKWVSKTAKKRFAYPTKNEAMVNFKARKKRQIQLLTNQLNNVKRALEIIENRNGNITGSHRMDSANKYN